MLFVWLFDWYGMFNHRFHVHSHVSDLCACSKIWAKPWLAKRVSVIHIHFQLISKVCYLLDYLTDIACSITASMVIVMFLICVLVLNFVPNHDWPRGYLWFNMHFQLIGEDCYLFGYLIDMACLCFVFGYSLWHVENWCLWFLDVSLELVYVCLKQFSHW